jgi:hypothetical protein
MPPSIRTRLSTVGSRARYLVMREAARATRIATGTVEPRFSSALTALQTSNTPVLSREAFQSTF